MRKFGVVLLLSVLVSQANAAVIKNSFIDNIYGARVKALGGIASVLHNNPESVYVNPATNAGIDRFTVVSSYASYFDGFFNQASMTAVVPVEGLGSISVAVPAVSVSGIPKTTNDPYLNEFQSTGTFDSVQMAGVASAALRLGMISIGTSAKYIKERINTAAAQGLGCDIGMMMTFSGKDLTVNVGASVTDVGDTLIVWESGAGDTIPMKTTVGLSVESQLEIGKITLVGDIQSAYDKRAYAGGVRFEQSGIALLGGVNRSGSVTQFTYGVGIDLGGIKIDYAAWENEIMGKTHKISVELTV